MEALLDDKNPWPLRALLLAVLGAVLGLALNFLLPEAPFRWSEDPLRLAAASFLVVGGIAFAFTLERERWRWSVLFALACGAVAAGVLHWNGAPQDWEVGGGWRLVSALIAVGIAAPLFQAARDAGRRTLADQPIHAHAWTNLVLWFAAWAFVLVCYLLANQLADLFHLIGLDQLRELMRKQWFWQLLVGAALGAGIGLLRDRDRVLFMVQRVVTAVLSTLVPLLALGLVAFVVALPFTGLQPLWDQTKATTPILLGCVIGAMILVNAAIGNAPEDESRAPPIRWGAAALAATALPLAMVALISTAKRIEQYGFTPDRLWALVFALIAAAVGAVYLFCLVRGRTRWPEVLRPANIRIAIGICLVALVLATPLTGFGAISTRNQLAPLQQGTVTPEDFDWAALRFDFGPSGRDALERLRASGNTEVSRLAANALEAKQRFPLAARMVRARRAQQLETTLVVLPRPAPLPLALRDTIAGTAVCTPGPCTLLWEESAKEAVVVGFRCPSCPANRVPLRLGPQGDWLEDWDREVIRIPSNSADRAQQLEARRRVLQEHLEAQRRALQEGRVEVRELQRRQVFIDGEPVGAPF